MIFETTIGLEIHVEMRTKSKMFSSSPNRFTREPNTHVTPYDLAHPGTMPVVNKRAVINAIRVSHALHMEIDQLLLFDRKNYFYSDLPKGYQITQQFHPIGKNGYVEFKNADGTLRRIHLQRLHMEEDTCKQQHFADYTLLDYNRAGIPLLEIVSSPEINDGFEAMKCVEAIRNIVVYSKTSDGKMEEGSLRCDVNISIRPKGSEQFGTKVEIKNINSLKNIKLALDYEIARQSKLLEEGKTIKQETRRYDDSMGKTIAMRIKVPSVDYKYFCEPNIAPIRLSDAFVEEAIRTCPESYEDKLHRYLSFGITLKDAEILLSDITVSDYFDKCVKDGSHAKIIANFIIADVNAYLNRNCISIVDYPLDCDKLSSIAKMQEEGYSHQQCVEVMNYLCEHPVTLEEAIEECGVKKQDASDEAIRPYVIEVLDENPQSIIDIKNGKDRAIGFLIGQVMKQTKGKLSPSAVSKIMKEEIDKR